MLPKVFKKMFKESLAEGDEPIATLYLENLGDEQVSFYAEAFRTTPHKKSPTKISFYPVDSLEEFLLCSGKIDHKQKVNLTFTDPRDAKSSFDFMLENGGQAKGEKPFWCSDRYGVDWFFHVHEAQIVGLVVGEHVVGEHVVE